jgi:DtxR family Mn-dependent transcriptional regulator
MRGRREDALPLDRTAAGDHVRLVRVLNQGPEFLRFLTEAGLEIGVSGLVRENNAEAGVVSFEVDGRVIPMAHAAAQTLLVQPVPRQPGSSDSEPSA